MARYLEQFKVQLTDVRSSTVLLAGEGGVADWYSAMIDRLDFQEWAVDVIGISEDLLQHVSSFIGQSGFMAKPFIRKTVLARRQA